MSLGLFLVAAMGGLFVHTRRYVQSHTPRVFILGHGLLALTADFILIISAM